MRGDAVGLMVALAINACQAQANRQGSPVTCLVPSVDWNPRTWETC